jgi:chemotaxis protein MotB
MRKAHTVRRVRKHEEHANHEAWAIPYGDLMTLLLAFFVVMYAMSSVNSGKYRVLSDSLFAAFRGAPRTMQPIQIGDKQVGSGADIATSIVQQSMLEGQPRSMLAIPVDTGSAAKTSGNPAVGPKPTVKATDAAAQASAALQKVADEVEHAMDDLVKQNLVVVKRTDFWIEVEIRTDILFQTGSAQLETTSTGVIERLADALGPFPNPIRVEGHTDNKPIKTVSFYSNWELSAARAGSVVRVLSRHGVDPSRLAVIGYGEQRPLQSNDTPQGRNANRRVVIVILSTQIKRNSDPAELRDEKPDSPGVDSAPIVTPGLPDPSNQAAPVPTQTTAVPSVVPAVPAATIPLAQPGDAATVPRPNVVHAAFTVPTGRVNTPPAGIVPAP